jgi:cytochrome P450 family 6
VNCRSLKILIRISFYPGFIWFVAGFETSSSTGSFVLYNLATNPEVQDKLRHEITTVLAKHKGDVTYEAMQEMKYLNMVVEGD